MIETEQKPTIILALWRQCQSGFEMTPFAPPHGNDDNDRDQQMGEMDRVIERRRRAVR